MRAKTKVGDLLFNAPPAVVISLDGISGLQAARILVDRGVPVIGVARDPGSAHVLTRVCEEIIFADTRGVGLIEALKELGPRLGQKAVLFPSSDASVWRVSQYRHELAPWYHFALPAENVVDTLLPKDSFYAYAEQNNFPISRTVTSKSDDDLGLASSLTFPCIVKPRTRSLDWEQQVGKKGFVIDSIEELKRRCAQIRPWSPTLVIQEWVVGGPSELYGCYCYFDQDSRLLVSFVSRKIRQWPHFTGGGCSGVECRNDDVRDQAMAVFEKAKMVGLGQIELKRDTRTGEFVIIEPNIGRPTGRSALAEAGGVELLMTMYCDLLGLPLPRARTQSYTGAKWFDFRHDCQSAFLHWRRGELTFIEWLRSVRGKRIYTLFAWNDPAPFIYDIWYAIKRTVRRRLWPEKGGS